LNGTENGPALITEIRAFSDEELTKEMNNL